MESKDKQFIMNMVMQGKFLAPEDVPHPKKKLTAKKGALKSNGSNKALVSQKLNDLDDIDDYQNPVFSKFNVSHMEKEEPDKKKNVVKKKKAVEKDVKTLKKATKAKATTIVV